MPNGETSSRSAVTAAVFILLTAMLVCPGMLLCVPSWSFRFFETGTIVLTAVGTALLFPQRVISVRDHLPRGLMIASGTLLAIGLWHGIRNIGSYNAAETGELFLTALFPFCICVFALGFFGGFFFSSSVFIIGYFRRSLGISLAQIFRHKWETCSGSGFYKS